ncbi:unnamed protein product [Cutaneotrichosporon oleaginosum]
MILHTSYAGTVQDQTKSLPRRRKTAAGWHRPAAVMAWTLADEGRSHAENFQRFLRVDETNGVHAPARSGAGLW